MDLKVCFLAQGPIQMASSRLRAWLLAEAFDDPDVVCLQHSPDVWGKLKDFDVVVLNKLYPRPGGSCMDLYDRVSDLKRDGKTVVWDLCDPVWYWMADRDFIGLAQSMDAIVVSSHGLRADLVCGYPKMRAEVIEDRLPFMPLAKTHEETNEPVLVWFGYFENRVPSFMSCALSLERLVQNDVSFKLLIIDDRPGIKLPVNSALGKRMLYKKWDLDTFWGDLMSADVALLPNYPGLWGKLKSRNKHMTAMWAGLPISDGENYRDLLELMTDARLRETQALGCRYMAEDIYNIKESVSEWENLMERIFYAEKLESV